MTKYNIGDRVEVTITGAVTGADGRFFVVDNDVWVSLDTPSARFRKLAPPKPEVGAVIDGARLKATPWKRGTVIREVYDLAAEHPHVYYMLTSEGDWADTHWCDQSPFADFRDTDTVEVVYLP